MSNRLFLIFRRLFPVPNKGERHLPTNTIGNQIKKTSAGYGLLIFVCWSIGSHIPHHNNGSYCHHSWLCSKLHNKITVLQISHTEVGDHDKGNCCSEGNAIPTDLCSQLGTVLLRRKSK